MATRGQGYTSTYLRGRREQLESAVAQATATITSDVRKYEAEKMFYEDSISSLDGQILEYDKLLADAISDREKLLRPRTSRVTRGGQRETLAMANFASGQSTLFKDIQAAEANIKRTMEVPDAFVQQLSQTTGLMASEDLDPVKRQARAQAVAEDILTSELFMRLHPAAQADTFEVINRQMKVVEPSFDLAAKDPTTGAPRFQLSPAAQQFLDPTVREGMKKKLEEEAGLEKMKAAREVGLRAILDRGATIGGGTYSVTKDELAAGEAERMKRIQSDEFQAVAKALRDDGVLSDAERAALEKANINPDDYLDDALMQAVARTGLLMARRGELVGRQEAARADLAALAEPDTSEQRRRELTSMQYGPAGITPTEALIAPRRVQERMGEERERLSAKQAVLQGVMRAASGDEFDLTDDENVYASQLAESVLGGNTAGIKQTYDQMREAGYDDDRIRSGFAVASRRAKDLAARREAQAQAAATTE